MNLRKSCTPRVCFAIFWLCAFSLGAGAAVELRTQLAAPPVGDLLQIELQRRVEELGHENYRIREAATQAILRMGEAAVPYLKAQLAKREERQLAHSGRPGIEQPVVEAEQQPLTEPAATQAAAAAPDAEIIFRLRFILDNIRLPEQAVLVVRPDSAGTFAAGDLITHIDNRRVRSQEDFQAAVQVSPFASTIRVRGPRGPYEIDGVRFDALPMLADFRLPQGAPIAEAIRLYANGRAEEAAARLATLKGPIPDTELSPLLQALIAYTAGEAEAAWRALEARPEVVRPLAIMQPWTSPSRLDLAGPHPTPFHVEWRLWQRIGESQGAEPDLAIQRVLVPAHRYIDALTRVSQLWWNHYRQVVGQDPERDRVAGNMLAVAAWMLHELDLQSECIALIEPRSAILRRSAQGVNKWIRVQTDAWPPFLDGAPETALNSFYEDAWRILQPPGPPANVQHIQSPQVAAMIAFFLYQLPDDDRVDDMLENLRHPQHMALADYAYWMLMALQESNYERVRDDLFALLPHASDEQALSVAPAAALLEYVASRPDQQRLAAARDRLSQLPASPERDEWLAVVEALAHLSAAAPAKVAPTLAAAPAAPGARVLRQTAAFLTDATAAALPPELQRCLLAAPFGDDAGDWLVVTRNHKLVRYDRATGQIRPETPPTDAWFPGPLNWPWLGRDETGGHVWIYDRRRIAEACCTEGPALALNIKTRDILAFDRYISDAFGELTRLVAGHPRDATEPAEFWCVQLGAGGSPYFSDPKLPEIGFIRPLPNEPRIVHLALRGGPHLLRHVEDGRTWTSSQLAADLGLDERLQFQAQALPDQAAPRIFLFSNAGLLRLDLAAIPPLVSRLDLPGDEPHPPLVPEVCPYPRRDPAWLYCARLPGDGGAVYRLHVPTGKITRLEMQNEALMPEYYAMQSRDALRLWIDARFAALGLPSLREFVTDAAETVRQLTREEL